MIIPQPGGAARSLAPRALAPSLKRLRFGEGRGEVAPGALRVFCQWLSILQRLDPGDVALGVGDQAALAHVEQDERVAPRVGDHRTAPDGDVEGRHEQRAARLGEGPRGPAGGRHVEIDRQPGPLGYVIISRKALLCKI